MKYQVKTTKDILESKELQKFSDEWRLGMLAASMVFPTKVSNYAWNNLIDWKSSEDPMFRLLIPQPDMLYQEDRLELIRLIKSGSDIELKKMVSKIRKKLNPHPSDQLTNIPSYEDSVFSGLQHKYDETILFFPKASQTCHSYCTFCFRFPQFINEAGIHKFAENDIEKVIDYIKINKKITDIIITGGDPLIMSSKKIEQCLSPFLSKEIGLKNIRLGTKCLSFWPHRFTTDSDAISLLKFFEDIVNLGINLVLMLHINHPRELEAPEFKKAISLLKSTGVTLKSQAPILKGISDSAEIWSDLWGQQVNLGIVPYYMFLPRDTGAHHFFSIPIVKAGDIYREAIISLSGLARTVKGPIMSTTWGKVEYLGVTKSPYNQNVLAFRLIQSINPDYSYKLFFSEFNDTACWIDELKPIGRKKFFFEEDYIHRSSLS